MRDNTDLQPKHHTQINAKQGGSAKRGIANQKLSAQEECQPMAVN
jgi:hypothetical protein